MSVCAKWSLSSDANSAFVFPTLPPLLRNVLFSEELRVHLSSIEMIISDVVIFCETHPSVGFTLRTPH